MRRSIACSASRAICISMASPREDQQAALTALPGDDPLVVLGALSDGLILPASEPAAEIATAFDFGADSHPIVHLHDGWSWDIAGADWTFDFHA